MGKSKVISYSEKPFKNRPEAGRLLGEYLEEYKGENTVILGIPRGGLIVAKEIAEILSADIDIVLARKIGAPGNPEFAIGSINEEGQVFINNFYANEAQADKEYTDSEKEFQLSEIKSRIERFRSAKRKVPLKNKIVIVTDDGIATGATMQAALTAVRHELPDKLIVAVPVCARETMEKISDFADETVVLRMPLFLNAISQFYKDFTQASDEDVVKILRDSAESTKS